MIKMELQQLKYFQAVARLEHMTRAAEELNITQPSLSITISRLEEDIGVPLFDRSGRQIKLNEFGKIFLKRVNRVFSELDEGFREVNDLAGLEYGTVSLAATNLVLLPELLNTFLSQYPQVKFRLFQDTTIKMQQQLEKGEVDLCITSPPVEGRGVKSIPLFMEEIILVVPKQHRFANREEIDLHELENDPFVSLKTGYGIRDTADSLCKQAGFAPNIAFEVNEPSLVSYLVQSGIGVAFLPMNAWKGNLEQTTSCLHIKAPLFQRTIGLSWLEERYFSAASQRLRQFVIDYFSRFSMD